MKASPDPGRGGGDRPAVSSALDSFTVEGRVSLERGWAEVRRYEWRQATEDVWVMPDGYFLDLSLTPRPGPACGTHLGLDAARAPEKLGRLIVVPPGFEMRSGCGLGRQRSLHCMVPAEAVNRLLPAAPRWTERALREGLHLFAPEIEWLLRKVYAELGRPSFGLAFKVQALVDALAVELIRAFDLAGEAPRPASGGLAPWRMKLIRDRAHAAGPAPSLDDLAAACGMTARHLGRAFKAETGQTLGKYVEAVMIERARALLAETRRPVAEIARELGFSTPNSFAYAFRRATGLRPREVARAARRPLA